MAAYGATQSQSDMVGAACSGAATPCGDFSFASTPTNPVTNQAHLEGFPGPPLSGGSDRGKEGSGCRVTGFLGGAKGKCPQNLFQKQLVAPCDGKSPYTDQGIVWGSIYSYRKQGWLDSPCVPVCPFASICTDSLTCFFNVQWIVLLVLPFSQNQRSAMHTLV